METLDVVVVGSGFGGIGAAIRLLRAGVRSLAVLERADALGGVWRDNHYPGCACDVQSYLYEFSFVPNPCWSRGFAPQPEIAAYLRHCAERFGVMPHLRFGQELRAATWEDGRQCWHLKTSRGSLRARLLVLAAGALSEPAIPALPGLERFVGPAFHSARWDHGYALAGRSVAVVGTGASAVQFIPAIQPVVGRLTVFQRTPPWVVPRRDYAPGYGQRRLLARFPILQRLARGGLYLARELLVPGFRHPQLMAPLAWVARRHLARQVPDPALRARLTPGYTIGCKRILSSDDYYPALTRQNVTVVTAPIREVRPQALVTEDGAEYAADCIIFGTGFQVTDWPLAQRVRGRDGRTLAEHWDGSPRAHVGTTVCGFPNLFLLQGPGTGLGHSSVLLMIEAQIEHLLGAFQAMGARGAAVVEPRPEAQAAFVAELDRAMRGTVWVTGGCSSWYLDRTGRNATLWPGSIRQFRRRVARFRCDEYCFEPPHTTPSA
ncbi:MAG: NAD(P)/FAD-dependent oxidoreductase [Chloroflexi bacterium OHK40]